VTISRGISQAIRTGPDEEFAAQGPEAFHDKVLALPLRYVVVDRLFAQLILGIFDVTRNISSRDQSRASVADGGQCGGELEVELLLFCWVPKRRGEIVGVLIH
jgi:hypothetical protein